MSGVPTATDVRLTIRALEEFQRAACDREVKFAALEQAQSDHAAAVQRVATAFEEMKKCIVALADMSW